MGLAISTVVTKCYQLGAKANTSNSYQSLNREKILALNEANAKIKQTC